jgi:plastocyanin
MAIRGWMLVVGSAAALACGGDDGDPQGPGDGDPEPNEVIVRNNSFLPTTLALETGGTGVWIWAANSVDHNVTFDDGENSPTQDSGNYTRIFSQPGTYPYHCTIHGTATSGMRGTVTVTDEAPAEDENDGGNGGSGGDGGGPDGNPGGY